MKRAYKFRIYPGKNQEVKLNRTLSTCRHLYNDSLAERKRQSDLNMLCFTFQVFPWGKPEWIDYYHQANELADSKTSQQKEVFSQVLQDILRRLDKNFKNFYRNSGYPRFKGRNRYNSFTYPQMGFELRDGKIKLSKIGSIRIILHREIEGRIKTCTIKKDIDQWYAIFTTEIGKTVEPVEVKNAIGIDVGLTSLLTFSTGEQIAPPEFLRKSEKKLANGTSRECHVCGNVEHLTLADRVFRCSRCGNIEDRDVNASINVLNRSTAGTAGRACKSSPIDSRISKIFDRDTMKQEAIRLVGW